MPIVLLSGFDVWGDATVNSSWEAVQAASPSLPAGWTLRKIKLPVSWSQSHAVLADAWGADVGAVIACGMGGRKAIHVEEIAINLTVPGKPDTDDCLPTSDWVVPNGPPAYFSGLPTQSLHDALLSASIPVSKSPHCGTYLCNFIFYWLMHRIHSERLGVPGGFLHIPSQGEVPSVDIATLAKGVAIASEVTVASAHKERTVWDC